MVGADENKVYDTLRLWFEQHNIKCWLNKGDDKFTISGSRNKPDLIIYSQRINQYVVIEVKKGNVARDIFEANKILGYWHEYTNGNTSYFINDNKINVDSFAVSTLFSMFGKLFYDDYLREHETKNRDWYAINNEKKLEPLWEYARTHDYLRNLWANWRKIRKKEQQAGLGIIVSDVLNQKKISLAVGQPVLFDMQWEQNKKWKVRQKWL